LPFGHAEDLSDLHKSTLAADLPLILEMTDALGASLLGRTVHKPVDIAILSLREGQSPLSTGEGGALLFRNPLQAAKAKSYARFSDLDGINLGINQKLSEPQAALGIHRLATLQARLDSRQVLLRGIADRLVDAGAELIATAGDRGAYVVVRRQSTFRISGIHLAPLTLSFRLPVVRGLEARCPEAIRRAHDWCGAVPNGAAMTL
jgi:dTDP-4-amino-4,6-dideoxygalactose transaminase